MNTKVTLTVTEDIKAEAARQSKLVLGMENMSAYFRFLIEREKNIKNNE